MRKIPNKEKRRKPLATSKLARPHDAGIPKGWTPDWFTQWTEEDEVWLNVCLQNADHWDDGHNPVECGRRQAAEGFEQNTDGRLDWIILREEAGFTMKDLAAQFEVNVATISRWESGQRWPDNRSYLSWLHAEGELHAQQIRTQLFAMQSKRDGWFHDKWVHTHQGKKIYVTLALAHRDNHWHTLYKPDGLFDRWKETGSLPAWTPEDAGINPNPDEIQHLYDKAQAIRTREGITPAKKAL